jgi:hypothetical protein
MVHVAEVRPFADAVSVNWSLFWALVLVAVVVLDVALLLIGTVRLFGVGPVFRPVPDPLKVTFTCTELSATSTFDPLSICTPEANELPFPKFDIEPVVQLAQRSLVAVPVAAVVADPALPLPLVQCVPIVATIENV